MLQVNIHEAKTHLSRLVDRAHAGETIIIAKNGVPWANLVYYNGGNETQEAQPKKNLLEVMADMGRGGWAAPDWKDNSDIIATIENK